MKKNNIYLLLMGGLLTFSACSDEFLQEKRDYSIMSSQDVFSDPKQAEAVFAEIYKHLVGTYSAPIMGSDPLLRQGQKNAGLNHFLSEELPPVSPGGSQLGNTQGLGSNCFANNGTGVKNTYAGNHIGGTFYWNAGQGSKFNNFDNGAADNVLYPHVNYINRYITEIKAARGIYSQAPGFWDHLEGQALFARAWLYFDAVRLWGGLPYYATDTDIPANDDRSDRLSIEACIDKICADFDAASKLLPPTWDANNYGRFTSVAALAMISRVRLYAASPVFNASWDNTGSRRWQAALDAALAAESAAKTAGVTGITSISEWDQAFIQARGAAENKEAVLLIPKSGDTQYASNANKWEKMIRPLAGSPGIPAPKAMIDLFPLKDGKRAVDKDGAAINGYNAEKFFLNRDPRFYHTFAFSGCQWPNSTAVLWFYAYRTGDNTFAYTDGSTGTKAAKQKSKAIVWKMANPSVKDASIDVSGASILEYRFAEILLNVAECYAAQGNTGKCAEYLNKIRSRVGAQAIPTPASKYEAIEACLYERRVELAYEGKRSWDCRRWLLYEGGAGFESPNTTANQPYNPNDAWGTGWRIYDGKEGRPNYTKTDNVITKLGLSPISGTIPVGSIWKVDFTNTYASDPIAEADKSSVLAITKDDDAGREAKLAALAAFYDTNLSTKDLVNLQKDAIANDMNINYAITGDSNNDQAVNFRFTWRGHFNVWPIHYNQRIQEANNTWITQNVGWNIGNLSGPIQDGTYVYCTPE